MGTAKISFQSDEYIIHPYIFKKCFVNVNLQLNTKLQRRNLLCRCSQIYEERARAKTTALSIGKSTFQGLSQHFKTFNSLCHHISMITFHTFLNKPEPCHLTDTCSGNGLIPQYIPTHIYLEI